MQHFTITIQDADGTPEDYVYIVEDGQTGRTRGVLLVESLRTLHFDVARYVWSPISDENPCEQTYVRNVS